MCKRYWYAILSWHFLMQFVFCCFNFVLLSVLLLFVCFFRQGCDMNRVLVYVLGYLIFSSFCFVFLSLFLCILYSFSSIVNTFCQC